MRRDSLQVGRVYRSRQSTHAGWRVRVIGLSRQKVQFTVLDGPGQTGGSIRWLPRAVFLTSYE